MYRAALTVAQNLDFDMAWLLEILLEIDIAIAESRLGFGLRGLDGVLELRFAARHLHAAPTATRRCLDQHRIADVLGDAAGLADFIDAAIRSGHHRYPKLFGSALGF